MKKLLVTTLALCMVAAPVVASADVAGDGPAGAAGSTSHAASLAATSTQIALAVGITAAVVALVVAGGDHGTSSTTSTR